MSLVDDLKAEAAKLLKEAELVEQKIVGDVTHADGVVKAAVTTDVTKVEADAKADVTKVETAVKTDVAKVETDAKQAATTAAADVAVAAAKVAAKVAPKGEIVVQGQRYAADGLTIEWKEKK